MNIVSVFVLFNQLYKSCFPLYRLFYFAYKQCSDRDKIKLLRKHVKSGMTVLDIGANIGFYTILLSGLVGKEGVVYAFEPDKLNFDLLEQLTKNLDNVKCINAACGEKNGTAFLFRSEKMNIDHQVYDSGESRNKIAIKMVSVDDYLKGEKNSISFIKIDVQGYDYFVFRGMKETVARSTEVFIIGELWPYGLKKAGSSADKYLTEVKEAGFDIHILSEGENNDFSSYTENKDFYVDFFARRQ